MPSHTNVAATIKTEEDSVEETAGEGVFHRKSKRRRVARDIFLVFEEQPSSRRSRGRGTVVKKPKFGHLKVENPTKKCLLRDIKNEPKCYLTHNNNNINNNNIKNNYIKKATTKSKLEEAVEYNVNTNTEVADVQITSCTKIEDTLPNDLMARVNPIFLWVKQDDTRIVEVRCEDYDKRNRIRITKTTNGWQAIPRTDPTSSRIVKFFQTPMLKVKHELYGNNTSTLDEKTTKATYVSQSSELVGDIDVDEEWCSVESLGVDASHQSGVNKTAVETDPSTKTMENEKYHLWKPNKKEKKKNTLKHKCANKKRRKKGKNTKRKKEKCIIESSLSNDVDHDTFPRNIINKKCELLNDIIEESSIVSDSGLGSQEPIIQKDNFPKCTDSDVITATFATHVKNDTYQLNNCVVNTNKKSQFDDNVEDVVEHVDQIENIIDTPELQLCPKTGLFLRNLIAEDKSKNSSAINLEHKDVGILIELVDSSTHLGEYEKILDDSENLDVETKNLKDLLDDADDLLQHCSDNANSDAELIDSLVKRSCENNLIHETDAKDEISNIANLQLFTNTDVTAASDDNGIHINEVITPSHVVETVNEPPKCLSFNEAGEIEGINGELYQSSNLDESFENNGITSENISANSKNNDTNIIDDIEVATVVNSIKENTTALENGNDEDKVVEIFDDVDTPRDLSYKKREEVCPPPESRSQCAVTSSSDIIKSPMPDNVPPVIETSSDTIKNLIFEQFIKMNALNSGDATSSPIRQSVEPIDLGTQKHHNHVTKSVGSKYMSSNTNFIETVVIDDNSDEEPVKKRIRRHAIPHSSQQRPVASMPASVVIDKDPDPLTQLQLLIKNTQWKVPDPILVPKDRLSAVLASPAREIPLLITTRPELRLPEAFAYPEIIQNPNILVISMAQLEAILKNELELEKSKSQIQHTTILNSNECRNGLSRQCHNALRLSASHEQSHSESKTKPVKLHQIPSEQSHDQVQVPMETHQLSQSKEPKSKCAPHEASLTSINATTLAMLNQLLWLPYFGQLSNDFLKKLKDPINNVHKSILSQYQPSQFGLQNIDELFKYYNKNINNSRLFSTPESVEPLTPCYTPNSIAQLQNPLEIAIFQKLVEHQMHNLLRLNTYPTSEPDSPLLEPSVNKQTANNINYIAQSIGHNSLESKKTNKSAIKSLESCERLLELPQKTNCGNVSDNIFVTKYLTAGSCFEKETHERDNKPRLTCKSLSNLLQPESQNELTAMKSVHLNIQDNLETDIKSVESKRTETHCLTNVEANLRMVRNDRTKNLSEPDVIVGITKQQQKPHCLNFMDQSTLSVGTSSTSVSVPDSANSDTNVLWHPLFGSNAKAGYSSPWQWTTVTATGE